MLCTLSGEKSLPAPWHSLQVSVLVRFHGSLGCSITFVVVAGLAGTYRNGIDDRTTVSISAGRVDVMKVELGIAGPEVAGGAFLLRNYLFLDGCGSQLEISQHENLIHWRRAPFYGPQGHGIGTSFLGADRLQRIRQDIAAELGAGVRQKINEVMRRLGTVRSGIQQFHVQSNSLLKDELGSQYQAKWVSKARPLEGGTAPCVQEKSVRRRAFSRSYSSKTERGVSKETPL